MNRYNILLHYSNAIEIITDITWPRLEWLLLRRGWSDWEIGTLYFAGGNVKWCRYFGGKVLTWNYHMAQQSYTQRYIFPRELKNMSSHKNHVMSSSTTHNSQVSTYGEMDKQHTAYSCYGVLFAVVERKVALTHALQHAWTLTALCDVKETRHRRPEATWLPSHEMSRRGVQWTEVNEWF